MKIAIASDHGGYGLKEKIKLYLQSLNHEVKDFGCFSSESCDYPDFIYLAVKDVSQKNSERAIIVCGSGVGASIVANKVPGIRCALCSSKFIAEYSRRHNDSNVLAFGERVTPYEEVKEMIDIWLSTSYEGGRHQKRLDKITALENSILGEKQ